MTNAKVTLKPNRERPVENGSPWVFSGAVASIDGYESAGQPCEIVSSDGRFLAMGYVNRDSRISCRVLSRERITVDESMVRDRIRQSFSRRTDILDVDTNACRLVNSEGDFLPGLIVDQVWRWRGRTVSHQRDGTVPRRRYLLLFMNC